MAAKKQPQKSFPLRLPHSTRQIACDFADREGISLNQFISMAIAEKIARMEGDSVPVDPHESSDKIRAL
jgi:predicted HicB family RNase H-like nuclease